MEDYPLLIKIEDIEEVYNEKKTIERLKKDENWKGKTPSIFFPELKITDQCFGKDTTDYYELLHHAKNRSVANLSEACNKIWMILEFLEKVKTKNHCCNKFKETYSLGGIYPEIYYSALSIIISNLSLHGIISVQIISENKKIDYNIILTKKGWKMFIRKMYLNEILKKGNIKENHWHIQLIETYYSIFGVDSIIEKEDINFLKKMREKYHYKILSTQVLTEHPKDIYELNKAIVIILNGLIKTHNKIGKVHSNEVKRYEERLDQLINLGKKVLSL